MLLFLLAGALCFTTTLSHAADHYISVGALGRGDGTDWSNAWSSFSSVVWARGDTYYVGGGTYIGNLTINRAASGSTWIHVKKATVSSHGTDDGWNDAYGAQSVINGRINIYSPYIVVDGLTGSENSGHGFKVIVQDCYTFPAVGIYVAANTGNVHVSHIEVQHCGEDILYANDGFYNNNTAPTSGIHVRYLYIHDLSRNGITLSQNVGDTLVEHNRIERLHPGDPNIHGQAIQLSGPPMRGITVRYNQFVDIAGTAALALLGSNSGMYSDIFFYGNVLWSTDNIRYSYSPAAVFGREGTSQSNVLSYNNTFYNVKNPNYWMMGDVITNPENRNNIYVNCDFQFPNGNANSTNNFYFGNTGGNVPAAEKGQINGTRAPFVDAPRDFSLLPTVEAIDRGMELDLAYAVDIAGTSRPQGAAWDIGAYEFVIIAPPPKSSSINPPKGLRSQ